MLKTMYSNWKIRSYQFQTNNSVPLNELENVMEKRKQEKSAMVQV
jgi:hypothetical protein